MNILKNTFAILALSILYSCSKDDVATTPQPTVDEPVSLLTKVTHTNDGLISIYSYDTNKRLINYKLNGNVNNAARNQNFIYNADGTLDKINNLVSQEVEAKYFYDTNKQLIKKEGRKATDVYLYTYSGNQITEKYSFEGVEKWIQIYTNSSNGNIVELNSFNQITAANPNGLLTGTFIYTYDDKKAAKLSFPKQFLFPNANKNNVLTQKYNANPVINYYYEYNVKGYPIKSINDNKTYEYQ